MRRPRQERQGDPEDSHAELKASAYQFAHRGLIGLLLWVFRRGLSDALARHLTIAAAAAAWIGALVLLALANRNDIALLRDISIYAVIGIPLLALVAWVSRQQRDALVAEHGRDSEAYERAIEAGHKEAAKTAMQEDWVLDPPWRRPESKRKPRFGRQDD